MKRVKALQGRARGSWKARKTAMPATSPVRSVSIQQPAVSIENGGLKHLLVDVDRCVEHDGPPLVEG
jgi:hypothetical protein